MESVNKLTNIQNYYFKSENDRLEKNSILDDSKQIEKKDTKKITSTGKELSEKEQKQVDELKKTDQKVRQHEEAHIVAGGSIVKSGPHYEYQLGPDGKRYAVAGEVVIDDAPTDNPETTISKMQQVQRAALAPMDPSAKDRAVAAKAAKTETEARRELMNEKFSENAKKSIFSNKLIIYDDNIDLNGKYIDLISK